MVTLQHSVDNTGDQRSIASRRQGPRVFVVDAAGNVLLRDVAAGSLSVEARSIAMNLIASRSSEDVLLGLAGAAQVVRLVRLKGHHERERYALFLEKLTARSPIEAASERFGLSEREGDVLALLMRGCATTEIAGELVIAQSTVATHVRNIGAKMNVSKRKEIVAAVLGGR